MNIFALFIKLEEKERRQLELFFHENRKHIFKQLSIGGFCMTSSKNDPENYGKFFSNVGVARKTI